MSTSKISSHHLRLQLAIVVLPILALSFLLEMVEGVDLPLAEAMVSVPLLRIFVPTPKGSRRSRRRCAITGRRLRNVPMDQTVSVHTLISNIYCLVESHSLCVVSQITFTHLPTTSLLQSHNRIVQLLFDTGNYAHGKHELKFQYTTLCR